MIANSSVKCREEADETHGSGLIPTGMVLIPAGRFTMGSADGAEGERPIHSVELDAYWIDEAPVTNARFSEFVAETNYVTDAERNGAGWAFDGNDFRLVDSVNWRTYSARRENHPVVMVSWFDAVSFASWAGKLLPTEAEWERAARGGFEGRLYPWGKAEPNGSQSNFAKTSERIPPTTPVKSFAPNAFGLYDMVGNVWQWCSDWYGADYYYSCGDKANPAGPACGTHRVRRGGAWNVIQPFRLRCANRGCFDPRQSAPNIGFRCVCSSREPETSSSREVCDLGRPEIDRAAQGDDGR